MARTALWRRTADEGMTLVEMSIALLIVAIVFAGSGLFLAGTLKAASTEEARVKGTQLGNQLIEKYRTLPWQCVGFMTTDTSATTTYSGHDTVLLTSPTDAACTVSSVSIVPLAQSATITVGKVAYTETPHIVWDDDPSDGVGAADLSGDNGHDVKHFYVTITWAGGHSLKVQGIRAPTAAEVTPRSASAITPFTVKAVTPSPSSATLDASNKTTSAITFAVTTSTNASQVRLSWPLSDGTTGQAFMTNTGSATSWTYTLAAGAGPFATGQVSFSARGYDATGNTADGTGTVTFAVTSGGLSVSINAPGSANIDSSGYLTSSLTVTAHASASGASMQLSYTSRSGAKVPVTMTVSGQDATYTFASGTGPFPEGNDTFTVSASSASGNASASATTTFTGPTVTAVSIDSLSMSPSMCYDNTGSSYPLLRSATVTLNITGLSSTDVISAQFADAVQTKYATNDSAHKISYSSGTAGGATQWTFTVPSGAMDWKGKTTASISVYATRYPDTTPTSRSFPLTLTGAHNASGCPAS